MNENHRKCLIFIERWFDNTDRIKGRPFRDAFVWGCHFTSFVAQQNVRQKIRWNGFDSYYWPDLRYQSMLDKMPHRTELARFSVIITSLPYMKELDQNFQNLIGRPDPNPYRRYGFHLYMRSNGSIFTGLVYFSQSQEVKFKDKSFSPIGNIYPVIRYEWRSQQPRAALTYGLDFRMCSTIHAEQNASGDRFYHRYGDQRIKAGNVFELTEGRLEAFKSDNFPTDDFIGLYVCAGAKLLVFDTYHEDTDLREHNRTLVQQGGLVICRGIFEIDLPVEIQRNDESFDHFFTDVKFRRMGFQEFYDRCLKRVDGMPKSEIDPDSRLLRQPVLFLGPINSKYGAVTWAVEVRKHSDKTPRKTVLFTPNHSRIIAIAEGRDALEEIRARTQYEMLHDSVVTNHGTEFAIPKSPEDDQEYDIPMVRRIVNPGNERSFNVEYDADPLEYLGEDIIQDVNISTVLDHHFEERFGNILKTQKTRWAVPPMYPPAVVLDQRGEPKVYSIPSREMNLVDFDNLYVDRPGLNLELPNPVDHTNTAFSFQHYGPVRGYHFERLQKKVEQPYKSGYYKHNSFYRLGVDGWMWKKVGTHITKEEICCFLPSPQESDTERPQRRSRSREPEDREDRKRPRHDSTQSGAPPDRNQGSGSGSQYQHRQPSRHRESSRKERSHRSQSRTNRHHSSQRNRKRSSSHSRNRSRDRSHDRKGGHKPRHDSHTKWCSTRQEPGFRF